MVGVMVMVKKKYYAIFDLETNEYKHSGFNARSRKDAIEDLWSWWLDANDEFDDAEVRKIAKDKELWFQRMGFRIDEQDEPFEGNWNE